MQYPCDRTPETVSHVHVRCLITKDDTAITHRERRKRFVPDKCGVKMIREGSHGPIVGNKRHDALLMPILVCFFLFLSEQLLAQYKRVVVCVLITSPGN